MKTNDVKKMIVPIKKDVYIIYIKPAILSVTDEEMLKYITLSARSGSCLNNLR